MAKNSCANLSQAELIAALGIPKSTYYRYIDDADYPLNADLRTQKEWVDARQRETGAKTDQPKVRKPKGKDEDTGPKMPQPGTKEWYDFRQARARAINEEAKTDEMVKAIMERGEKRIRLRLGKMMERLGEIVQQELCSTCSEKLAAEWERVKAELDQEEIEELEEMAS